MKRYSVILMLLAAVLSVGCKDSKNKADATQQAPEVRHWPYFDGNYPMVVTTDSARMEYLCRHSWDTFDFSDTLALRNDTSEVLTEFAGFIQTINYYGGNDKPAIIEQLIAKASTSRTMLEYFAWQAREVLADPNSPIRNDELYIPVVRGMLATGFYNFAERTRLEYKLDIMLKNRIGHKANDFTYTLESGRKSVLYGLRSDFVLIFFNNPGCPMCREVREELRTSELVSNMVNDGSLTILAMYPDEEVDEWLEHKAEFPTSWICAYDNGCKIRGGAQYDVSAIPSLYLLDKDKTVLLKDITDVKLLEETLAAH